jgi:hypothetical protein
MQYRVFFTTGESVLITEESFTTCKDALGSTSATMVVVEGKLINFNFVTHSVPVDSLEQPGSVVIPTPPDDIRKAKKLEQDKIKSDADAILKRTKDTYEEDQMPSSNLQK